MGLNGLKLPLKPAFDVIKVRMIEAPILQPLDFSKIFEVACDASG